MSAHVATVAGVPIGVDEVDAREAALRSGALAAALPAPGTSEGRQLRRWLTQLLVAERVVAVEATHLGITACAAPPVEEILPDGAARLEIGSVAASVLGDPIARAVFVRVTSSVDLTDGEVADYHARNPLRFARKPLGDNGWRSRVALAPPLEEVRWSIVGVLSAAARRRAFRRWLDARVAELVELAPGYEHPGDPSQPDNTHRH